MRSITDLYPDHYKVRLGIGEGGLYINPTVVTTVLGSCVSVTFYCKNKKIGAIFHALLPEIPDNEKNKLSSDCFKYVDASIRHILHSFGRRGVKTNQIEAKVFGGAEGAFKGVIKPGEKNILTAYEVLAAHDIKIVASGVGGSKGRNLVFISNTGEVFVKSHADSIKVKLPVKNRTHQDSCLQKLAV